MELNNVVYAHALTDNFFICASLIKRLCELKIFFTGTVRKNKIGLLDGIKQNL